MEVIHFYHYLPISIHLSLGKRGSQSSKLMEEVQSFTVCHEISCRNYVPWNVWPWKVQVSPNCNYSLGFWEVYNSAAEMMPAWTEHTVQGVNRNKPQYFSFRFVPKDVWDLFCLLGLFWQLLYFIIWCLTTRKFSEENVGIWIWSVLCFKEINQKLFSVLKSPL